MGFRETWKRMFQPLERQAKKLAKNYFQIELLNVLIGGKYISFDVPLGVKEDNEAKERRIQTLVGKNEALKDQVFELEEAVEMSFKFLAEKGLLGELQSWNG